MKLLMQLANTPAAIALACLFAGTANGAADSSAADSDASATLTKQDVLDALSESDAIRTLQRRVDELANRGGMVIVHAVPAKPTTTGIGVTGNAATYVVLGNTIQGGSFSGKTFGDRITGGLTVPDGDYLLELLQPPLLSVDSECAANTSATVWGTHTAQHGGTGHLPHKCRPARIFINTAYDDGTRDRYRIYNGTVIYAFQKVGSSPPQQTKKVTHRGFDVRFQIPAASITEGRPAESYAAILKITRLN